MKQKDTPPLTDSKMGYLKKNVVVIGRQTPDYHLMSPN